MKSIYEELSEERKKLQQEGLLPQWFTTSGWQLFSSKYVTNTEKDFKSVAERISKCAAKWTNDPELWEKKFYNLIWKGWLSCATPVLANMGTTRGCPVSCSSNYVADSVYDFYESQKEVAVLSKHGFGTSSYLGDIRPRGSDISVGGKSSGILPVLKDFIQISRDISQGCYDSTTKVLTENGFFTFEELLTLKDIKVGYITEQGNIDYCIPTDYIKYQYTGNMIRFVGDGIDIKVTPDHNMVVYDDETFSFESASNIELTQNKHFKTIKVNEFPKLIPFSDIKKSEVSYDGFVYCVTVPTNRLIVESNGFYLICGNSQRRGAWAGYIPIDHKDFWEIVTFINTNPDDCNIGWVVSDEFIAKLNSGDKKALARYQRAMKTKMITGKGYFFFVDKVNRLNPDCYKDKDLKVKSSNLCISGDSLIEFSNHPDGNNSWAESVESFNEKSSLGYYEDFPIYVKSYNIELKKFEFKRVHLSVQKELVDEMYEIEYAPDKIIRCTGDHKILTNRGYVMAKDLLETDDLITI